MCVFKSYMPIQIKMNNIEGLEEYELYEDCSFSNMGGHRLRVYMNAEELENNIFEEIHFDNEELFADYIVGMKDVSNF